MSDENLAVESKSPGGLSWSRLLFFGLAGIAATFALLMAAFMFFDPFLTVFVVVFAVAAFLVRRGGRGPVIFALVLGVVFFGLNAPFLGATLAQPSSAPDFLPAVLVLIFDVLVIVSSIMVLRRRTEPSPGPRTAARVAGVVFALAAVLSIVAAVTFKDAVAEDGDISLVTQDTEFQDESLQGDAGTVAVFVENKDQTLHTFTIDKLDVDLQIPAGASTRVEFDAAPGEYKFYCVPHAGLMEGTLVIK
jgi:plastocyanin